MTSQWTEHKDENGRTFYFNAATGVSRWDKPSEVVTSLTQQALEECDWKEYTTDEGQKYYFNTETQETQWEMPSEYELLLARVTAEIQANLTAAPQKEYAPIGMEFRSKEEAQGFFNEMLEDIGVQSNWTYEMAVRRGYSHKYFKALKSVGDRIQAFDYYIRSLKERNMRDLNRKMAQDEKILRQVYSSMDIDPEMKYAQVLEQLKGNEEFESTHLLNRRIVFQKYISELRESAKEKERLERKEMLERLVELFPTIGVTNETTWAQFQIKLAEYVKTQDAEQKQEMQVDSDNVETEKSDKVLNLKVIDDIDILIAFEDFVDKVDRQEHENLVKTQQSWRQKDRLARVGFRQLLKEMIKQKKLDINSKWKHIFPLIKDDPRYLEILDSFGSTAMELFWDELMIMEDRYRPDRRKIFDIVRVSCHLYRTPNLILQHLQHFTNFQDILPKILQVLTLIMSKLLMKNFCGKQSLKSERFNGKKNAKSVKRMIDSNTIYATWPLL
jgi:pre-mRNA-processing factor 40